MKANLFEQKRFVLNFLTKNKLEKFKENIDEYFNYIWKLDTGVDENQILGELPANLKADVRLARYSYILNTSTLFKQSDSEQIDAQLARSILRVMDIEYYTTGDSIVHQNEHNTQFYILLDGDAKIMKDDQQVGTLSTGS